MRQPNSEPFHGLVLPRPVRNLMANPVAFLSATFGLFFMLGLKILAVNRRRSTGEREG